MKVINKAAISKRTILSLLFCIFSLSGFCQNSVDKQQIINQLRALRNAIAETNSTDSYFLKYQTSCRTIINDAILTIDRRDNGFPPQYLESLVSLTGLSKGLQTASPNDKRQQINLIRMDLMLKFRSSNQTLNDPEITRLVPMSVVVYKGGHIVNFLRVNYSALAYVKNYRFPDHQFNQLTSPANEDMVPGLYEIWITEDGSTTILRKKNIEVDPSANNHRIEFNL